MLTIRQEQMEVLADYSLGQFVRHAMTHLDKTSPKLAEDLDREELREFVLEMLEKAETFGIDTEEEVLTYIRYAAQFGRDFSTRYEWANVLTEPGLDGEEKIELLEANTPADVPAN